MIPENNYVVPAEYLEDKDTILLPARPGAVPPYLAQLAAHFTDEGREGQMEFFGKIPTYTMPSRLVIPLSSTRVVRQWHDELYTGYDS